MVFFNHNHTSPLTIFSNTSTNPSVQFMFHQKISQKLEMLLGLDWGPYLTYKGHFWKLHFWTFWTKTPNFWSKVVLELFRNCWGVYCYFFSVFWARKVDRRLPKSVFRIKFWPSERAVWLFWTKKAFFWAKVARLLTIFRAKNLFSEIFRTFFLIL